MILESSLLRLENLFTFRRSKCLQMTTISEDGNIDYENWQKLRLNCITCEVKAENCIKYESYMKFLLTLINNYKHLEEFFTFSWYISNSSHPVTKNTFLFELENVALNYCSFLMHIAFGRGIKDLKGLLKQFKIALGMLNFMKERAIYFVEEFGRLSNSICYLIQVCYLESSLKKELKTNNLLDLKVINSIVKYLEEAGIHDGQIDKFWFCYKYFTVAKVEFGMKLVGKAINSLQICIDKLKEIKEMKEDSFNSLLNQLKQGANQLIEKYEKENSLVWNQRIVNEKIEFENEFGFADFVQEISFVIEGKNKEISKPTDSLKSIGKSCNSISNSFSKEQSFFPQNKLSLFN